jgi:hypothetical protein
MAYKSLNYLGGLLAVVGVTLAVSRPANACGGLFCSAQSPVNQAAERIIFSQGDDGTTTAVIEIQYQGPSENFSWVLPVPGVPEVALSSKQALDRLQNQTEPRYSVTTDFGNCPSFLDEEGGDGDFGFADAGAPAVDGGAGGVQVLASGSVGPYDFTVIEVDANSSEPAQLMLDWLDMNGYDVSLLGEDLLGEYVAEGMNFLAVRLSKSSDSGSIRPVMITYQSERPVIPIRPTAVAANPDMGVMTWVLGSTRAIPTNYRSLELNDALIDWFNPFSTYDEVVIAAANEAGGHGFVTEHAGSTDIASDLIWFPAADSTREYLDDLESSDLLWEASINFGSLDGFVDVVAETVPLPGGVTAAEFLSCIDCYLYESLPDGGSPILGLDRQAFLSALDRLVIEPMRQTQALFDNATYTTRMYTTLSADEMTVDPEFDFNPDLEDVSNFHEAEQVLECSDGGQRWSMLLPSGVTVRGTDLYGWPIDVNSGLPYNMRILQYSTSGDGEVIIDNQPMVVGIVDQFPLLPAGMVPNGGPGSTPAEGPGSGPLGSTSDGGVSVTSDTYGDSDCGCRVPGRGANRSGAPALGFGLLALAVLRRRRYQGHTG